MAQKRKWIALSYTLPIEPSKARVYVWRKLREFGAQSLRQGVALLPAQERCQKDLERLSQRILTMGGQAVLFEMTFLDAQQEKAMLESFEKQGQEDYEEFGEHAREFLSNIEKYNQTQQLRRLRSLEREYQRLIRQRQTLGQPVAQLENGLHQIWGPRNSFDLPHSFYDTPWMNPQRGEDGTRPDAPPSGITRPGNWALFRMCIKPWTFRGLPRCCFLVL